MLAYNPDCKKTMASLTDYVDGDLSEALCKEIEKHLLDCDNCQVVIHNLRKTIEINKANSPVSQVPASVMQRIHVRLNLDDYLSR